MIYVYFAAAMVALWCVVNFGDNDDDFPSPPASPNLKGAW